MSSNLAVTNFSVGGTLTVSGVITFGREINSIGNASCQGMTTNDLVVTRLSTFTDHLPTSSKIPSIDTELTNKLFVDSADLVLNTRITDTDAFQKIYIDEGNTVLNERITSVDLLRKTFVDNANSTLDLRIISVDLLRKTYVDNADKILNDIISTLNSRIVALENYNKPPESATILQTVTFGDATGDKLFYDNNIIGSTPITTFQYTITPKSLDSTIEIYFALRYTVSNGTGDQANIPFNRTNGTSILIVSKTGYNVEKYKNPLLPISGSYLNKISASQLIEVIAKPIGAGCQISFNQSVEWSATITETQN